MVASGLTCHNLAAAKRSRVDEESGSSGFGGSSTEVNADADTGEQPASNGAQQQQTTPLSADELEQKALRAIPELGEVDELLEVGGQPHRSAAWAGGRAVWRAVWLLLLLLLHRAAAR
jgi:hypothetical protein